MNEVGIFGSVLIVSFLLSVVVGCFLALRWASKIKRKDDDEQ